MMQHLTNNELIDYLHNALPAQADAAVYAHLEQCASCREEYDAEAALTEFLRGYAAREEREMPATLKAEIWSRIRGAQPTALQRLAALWRPAMGVPVAAAIALAAYFSMGHGTGAPAIDAAYYLQDHAALTSTVPFNERTNVHPAELEGATAASNQQQQTLASAASAADAIP